MRALKLVGMVLGGLVVLLIAALLAIRLFVNPNDYKDRIAQSVKNSTGRELVLSGPIKLSVFPWVALELGPASLGNPAGFSNAQPFAALQRASFRVKLLPLLHKELEIGKVEIDGLDLRLQKNAAGVGNWQNFGNDKTTASATPDNNSGPSQLPELAGVEVKNSRLSYQDMTVENIELDLGQFAPGKPTPLKLTFDVSTSKGAKPLKFAFSAPALSLDTAAQTFSAPAFTMELASARLSGNIQANKILAAPVFAGGFRLEPVSLRTLMGDFGIIPPKTRDANVLGKFAAGGKFNYGANALTASDVDIQLDDSRLRGKVAVTDLDTKATSFDLSVDKINVDRYRSPEDPNAKAKADAEQKAPADATKSSDDVFKTLAMNGTLKIDSITVSNINMTQVSVTMAAKNGLTHIAPVKAKLYGGDYSGDITIDDRSSTPTVTLAQNMTGIDMAPLLKDFAKTQRVTGHGTVTTNLTTHALGGDALMKTLGGHVSANVDNGAIEGVDLWFEINRAVALIQKQAMPSGQSSGRTKFDSFKVSADITNGVAASKDLDIASQNLKITGQGTANLITEAIDYKMKATVLKQAPGTAGANAGSNTLADIPLNITGTMSSPTVRPDLEELAKAQLQNQLNKHKDELQQKLTDKLKGLLH